MDTGRPKQTLDLTEQERVYIEAIISSRSLPHGLVRRAQMILLTESGVSVRETVRRVKVTMTSLRCSTPCCRGGRRPLHTGVCAIWPPRRVFPRARCSGI